MTPEEQVIFDAGLKERQERASARWDREKLQDKLDREEKKENIKKSIMILIHQKTDFETMVDTAQCILLDGGLKLTHKDFILISDAYQLVQLL